MRGRGRGLIGTAVLALGAGAPGLAQDGGGLHLTLGVTERLQVSQNAALTSPSSGQLTTSTTSLSFGLSSETRTQVFRLGVSGDLRFEDGALVERFDAPSLSAFYSLTGANSLLELQVGGRRSRLADNAPTAEDPDPQGPGSRTTGLASARLDLGQTGPLGLTLEASRNRTDYSADAVDQDDTETRSASATGHLRLASGAEARLRAGRTDYSEDNAEDLQRQTTGYSLGWVQPLSPVLTLDAELGHERVDTFEFDALTDQTEGLSGHAALTLELANGSAGLNLSQSVEAEAVRQSIAVNRRMDLGNQTIALSFGATRLEGEAAHLVGNASWTYQADVTSLSLNLGRNVSGGPGSGVTTDRLALGLSREISQNSRLGLSVAAARIDSVTDNLVERTDITASYSRDLGRDWLMTLGASLTMRDEETEASAASRLLFLSFSRTFDLRP